MRIQTPQFVEPSNVSLDIEADDSRNELARIHAAYSRRIDQSRYSLFDPANLLAAQEREKEILSALTRGGCSPLDKFKNS